LVVAILLFAVMSLAVCGLAEQAFATTASPSASAAGLPDGRVAELVSTAPGGFGEPYQPTSPLSFQDVGVESSEHPFQAAEGGDAVSYVGEPPETGGTGETGPGEGNQWLAVRSPTGWVTTGITPSLVHSGETPIYQAFSGDLSTQIFLGGREPLTPGVATECRALYARSADGSYRALASSAERPEGLEEPNFCGHPLFAGASKDEAQVIFQSEAALAEGAEEALEVPAGHQAHSETGTESGEPCMFGCNLYETAGGHVRLISTLEGKAVPNATFGGYAVGEEGEGKFTALSNAISADGSRIFWTDTQEGPHFEHVYVLENGVSTIQVSGEGAAQYWTATPDGRYAFYTEEGELWRFDTEANTRLRLTAEGAEVQGVIGTNQTGSDGGYVYFVANGILAGNENEANETATAGQPNVYLDHEGTTTFIATLSPEDNTIVATSVGTEPGGDWLASPAQRTDEITPDGRSLVFESRRKLTGYNNANSPGGAVIEVFVYSADHSEIACASCDPAGAVPSVAPEKAFFKETRLPVSANGDSAMRRWMSEDGNRVFFDSEQPLVSQDTNGTQDVYEWEREGSGSCGIASPARLDRGCVFLLSGGGSQGYSFLVDADRTGDNVFLEHQGPLGQVNVPVDRNELYDVRVGGGFPGVSLACSGGGCEQSPASSPTFGTPGTAEAVGGGNFFPQLPPKSSPPLSRHRKLLKVLEACKRMPKHKRLKCEISARKRYGSIHRSLAAHSHRKVSK
jgi:hypothetical protein